MTTATKKKPAKKTTNHAKILREAMSSERRVKRYKSDWDKAKDDAKKKKKRYDTELVELLEIIEGAPQGKFEY